ncbi:MAG: Nif3-like dinuclear metal center hexameric protein, partial [Actinomycetota bacterium]|nr:Nif3-like dinuclear metal center hexameric protein [Actinomycetota bacterium]
MTSPATLNDVATGIQDVYPPRWADEGDAIGLIVGEPESRVERALFAVDPVSAVVEEAIAYDADLLIAHHPLLYRAVTSVAADRPKGRVIHELIRHGIGLYVAHTNADSPARGVSESMAFALGLS